MKLLFDQISEKTSRMITHHYSTSFSLGIRLLAPSLRAPVYGIYGFVRLADEIVDSFHDYNRHELFERFCADTWKAIEDKISLNPVLNTYQRIVHQYGIDRELTQTFLNSMEMDLSDRTYNQDLYEQYILGSAEVVGLMCLRVFVNGDDAQYELLKPYAMKLGSAFQKVNFLRDYQADSSELGRHYFPQLANGIMDEQTKREVEADIMKDFAIAFEGIRMLPKQARLGVYIAYIYYTKLLRRIMSMPAERIMKERVRVSDQHKLALLFGSYFRHSFNLL